MDSQAKLDSALVWIAFVGDLFAYFLLALVIAVPLLALARWWTSR